MPVSPMRPCVHASMQVRRMAEAALEAHDRALAGQDPPSSGAVWPPRLDPAILMHPQGMSAGRRALGAGGQGVECKVQIQAESAGWRQDVQGRGVQIRGLCAAEHRAQGAGQGCGGRGQGVFRGQGGRGQEAVSRFWALHIMTHALLCESILCALPTRTVVIHYGGMQLLDSFLKITTSFRGTEFLTDCVSVLPRSQPFPLSS